MSVIAPRPAGLVAAGNFKYVESDVHNIVSRVQEIDPTLFVMLHEGHEKPWVIVERGPDGVDRFVKRYEELDPRILEDLRYMLHVPFEERMARLEKEEAAANRAHGEMSEGQMDRLAWEMQRALRNANISDPMWFNSYRPKAVPR